MCVITTARGMPTSAHSCHSIRVAPSIVPPAAAVSVAEMTNRAASAARSPARSSPTKSAWPGVSTKLIRTGPGTRAPRSTTSAGHGQRHRSTQAPLHILEIADRAAVLDRSESADRPAAASTAASTSRVLPARPGPTSTTLRPGRCSHCCCRGRHASSRHAPVRAPASGRGAARYSGTVVTDPVAMNSANAHVWSPLVVPGPRPCAAAVSAPNGPADRALARAAAVGLSWQSASGARERNSAALPASGTTPIRPPSDRRRHFGAGRSEPGDRRDPIGLRAPRARSGRGYLVRAGWPAGCSVRRANGAI